MAVVAVGARKEEEVWVTVDVVDSVESVDVVLVTVGLAWRMCRRLRCGASWRGAVRLESGSTVAVFLCVEVAAHVADEIIVGVWLNTV